MKYLRYALQLCAGLLILIFLLTKVPFKDIAVTIGHARISFFVLSVLVGVFSVLVSAVRWQVLLKSLGYEYPAMLLVKITFMTLFFNVYLPGGVVGDLARVALLPEQSDRKRTKKDHLTKVTASVVTDRLAGLIGLMFIAVISMLIVCGPLVDAKISIIFLAVALIVSAVFFVFFSRRTQKLVRKVFALPLRLLSPVKTVLKEFSEALLMFRDDHSVFYKVISLSVLGHLCVVGYFLVLSRSIGLDIVALKLLAFVPVIEFVSAMPISIGGAGVREVATILLFGSVGIPAVESMSVSLLSFMVLLLLGAVGGVLFVSRRGAGKL